MPRPQPVCGRLVRLKVVGLVADRLLVRHALRIDALAYQARDAFGRQSLPVTPVQDTARGEQAAALVQGVVAVTDEEARVGEDRAVRAQRLANSGGLRRDDRGTGQDPRADRRRMIVPREV